MSIDPKDSASTFINDCSGIKGILTNATPQQQRECVVCVEREAVARCYLTREGDACGSCSQRMCVADLVTFLKSLRRRDWETFRPNG